MEICNTHNTHNLSYTSSEAHYNLNNKTSSSSSEEECIEGNKSHNEWSKLIKCNLSKALSNGILNESEINITNKSYEDKKENKLENKTNNIIYRGKYKSKKKKNKKIKKRYNLDGKFIMLENGILVKNLNKERMKYKPPLQKNIFLIQKEKTINNPRMINNNNPFLSKFRKNKNDSFQVIFIKRPQRSFITKICKYKNKIPIKRKEFKKYGQSSSAQNSFGLGSKLPNSSRLTPIPTSIIQNNEKGRFKTLIKNKNHINDNSENRFASLSTTSIKKVTKNSNTSLCFSKSNNILYNHLKKRPLSSMEREEKYYNLKNSKIDNFDITTYNKSYNNIKTRPISSMMNSQINQNDKSIYDNINFIKEFKELKSAFETCDNINNDKTLNNFDIYNNYYNTLRKSKDRDINKKRKLKSASDRNNSFQYQQIYNNGITPLINLDNKNKFEEEKGFKQNKCSNNILYQKHFGNDKTCPICVTMKEQNHLREEKLNNRNYYFPFKDKYDSNYSFQNTFKNHNNSFNIFTTEKRFKIGSNYINLFNIKKENTKGFLNPFNLNNIINSPHNVRKKIMRNKFKYREIKRNKSNIIGKYDFLQKYFE